MDVIIGWAVVSEPPWPVKATDWTLVEEPEGTSLSAAVTGTGAATLGLSWANSMPLLSNDPPGPVTRNCATWLATLTNTWKVSLAWVTPVPTARGVKASELPARSAEMLPNNPAATAATLFATMLAAGRLPAAATDMPLSLGSCTPPVVFGKPKKLTAP